jgi:hypothetical protein
VTAAIEAGQRADVMIERPVYTRDTIVGWEPVMVVWSARVEHLAEVVAADDALAADDVLHARRGGSVHVEEQSVSIRA